ncbi:Trehalose-phosphate phosphatase [Mycobacterium talmoniae]|uniref:Trehalose-phosphate phosphatase n=1 Tax=Mycobacterium talmoniae TaxID=1858794 RepID=A0A2S8BR41_9MYCO|nr:Trehalose-phosphate phosphatase [Mycobacterium talmoniae]
MPVTIDPRRHDAVLFDLDAVVTGAPVSDSTVALVRQLRDVGVGAAVFSSHRASADVLAAVGLSDLFEVRVDGSTDAAVLAKAAQRVGARPGRCVVIAPAEDAITAARDGGFALVIGLDATGRHADALRGRGADVVVTELSEVVVRTGDQRMSVLPDATSALLDEAEGVQRPAVFFDFDGTLSDIVDDPDAARLTDGAGEALQRLAAHCPVAVLSGRDLAASVSASGCPGSGMRAATASS